MLSSFKTLLQSLTQDSASKQAEISTDLAIAALLSQIAQADETIDENEQQMQRQLLIKLTDISPQQADELLQDADKKSEQATSLFEFTDRLRELKQEQRFALIQAMWQVAYADGQLDPVEESIIRKVAELLYVSHQDFIRAKLSVNKK